MINYHANGHPAMLEPVAHHSPHIHLDPEAAADHTAALLGEAGTGPEEVEDTDQGAAAGIADSVRSPVVYHAEVAADIADSGRHTDVHPGLEAEGHIVGPGCTTQPACQLQFNGAREQAL